MAVRIKKIVARPAVWAVGLFCLLLFAIGRSRHETESAKIHAAAKERLAEWVSHSIQEMFVPMFSFVEQGSAGIGKLLVDSQVGNIMPLYRYYNDNRTEAVRMEGRMTIDMILLAEANEEKEYDEEYSGDYEDILPGNRHPMERQNEDMSPDYNMNYSLEGEGVIWDRETGTSLEDLLRAENEMATRPNNHFLPAQKRVEVNFVALRDYETLVGNFYTIDSSTMIGSDQLSVDKLNRKDMTITKDGSGPQILIYHTHSQEAFADSIPGDPSTTIVGVGAYLAQILAKDYGYQVLHHTARYDVESRDDAYAKALPDITQLLDENPEIQVVLDLHRDSMPKDRHLVVDLNGMPTAQFMFFNGISRTRKTGNISYLYNENLEDNLAFSFQMQVKAAEYYPGLTRKIYLKGYRYNMHLRPKSSLIEMGAQNNTVEEVMNACHPLAHILDMVLSGGY